MRSEFSGTITKPHQHLHDILVGMGFQVTDNADAPPYKIDCLIENGLGFECDGKMYHLFKKRDKKRDLNILTDYGIRICRFSSELLTGKYDDEVKKAILEFINNDITRQD